MTIRDSFTAIVRFDEQGDVACFCYEEEQESCGCVGRFPCARAKFNIEIQEHLRLEEIPQSSIVNNLKAISRKTEHTSRKIKESVRNLEKSMRNTKFRL